jgi:hypothetical protein
MNKTLTFVTLLFLLLLPSSYANDLVKFPVIATAWDVQITASKFINSGNNQNTSKQNTPNPAHAGPQLTAVTVAQDNSKRRYQATYSNGEIRESWEIPQYSLVMMETPNGNIAMRGLPPEATPFGPAAFQWLKPEFLKSPKPVTFQNKACLYYEGTRDLCNDEGKVLCALKCAAWIEAGTLLPVALDDGVNFGTFKFREETTLKIPEKFKKKIDRYILFNGLPKLEE